MGWAPAALLTALQDACGIDRRGSPKHQRRREILKQVAPFLHTAVEKVVHFIITDDLRGALYCSSVTELYDSHHHSSSVRINLMVAKRHCLVAVTVEHLNHSFLLAYSPRPSSSANIGIAIVTGIIILITSALLRHRTPSLRAKRCCDCILQQYDEFAHRSWPTCVYARLNITLVCFLRHIRNALQ